MPSSFSGSSASRKKREQRKESRKERHGHSRSRSRSRDKSSELKVPTLTLTATSESSARSTSAEVSSVAAELGKSPVVAASSLGARVLAMLPMLAPKTAQRGKATDGGFRSKTPEAPPDVPKPVLVRRRSNSAPAEPERIVDSMTGEVVAVTAVPTSEQKRQRPKFARGESRV